MNAFGKWAMIALVAAGLGAGGFGAYAADSHSDGHSDGHSSGSANGAHPACAPFFCARA